MSRTENAMKNIATIWIEKIIVMIASFVLRTVFIKALGVKYVGLDGLFTNILTMLSLSELGVGTAMTYSMYKPIAQKNEKKLAAIMLLYKNVYRVIAVVITILGILLLPVLNVFIKEPPTDINIYVIYLGFLINTVLSYLFTYKRSMLNANQQAYKYTLIDAVSKIIILGLQSIVLLIFKNYYFYLVVLIVCSFLENVFVSYYVDKLFPFLNAKNIEKLDAKEKHYIIKNIKALFLHKIGDFAINSTDNMLISTFINIATTGMVSNYNLIISGINTFVNNFFTSLAAGIGNFIVREDKNKQLIMLETLNFIGFWIYGFASLGFYFFLTPVVIALWGEKLALSQNVVLLMVISQYLTGMRVPLGTFKTSAGIYNQDKYVPLLQAAINLVVSIVAVIHIGLPGIFIGTIVSSVVLASWNRAYVVYKYVFDMSARTYFIKYGVQVLFIILVAILLNKIYDQVPHFGMWGSIIFNIAICTLVYNGLIVIIFHRTDEFKRIINIFKDRVLRRRK